MEFFRAVHGFLMAAGWQQLVLFVVIGVLMLVAMVLVVIGVLTYWANKAGSFGHDLDGDMPEHVRAHRAKFAKRRAERVGEQAEASVAQADVPPFVRDRTEAAEWGSDCSIRRQQNVIARQIDQMERDINAPSGVGA